MKKLLFFLFITLCFSTISTAQNKHNVGFNQIVDVKTHEGDSFHLKAAVKLVTDMEVADVGIFANVIKQDETRGILYSATIKDKKNTDWKVYSVKGTIDKNPNFLMIGGYCAYNGYFYFDDFTLSIQKDGEWREISLENAGFENTSFEKVTLGEKTYDKKMIQGWGGFVVQEDRATFTPVSTSEEVYAGKHALLVKGEGDFYAPDTSKYKIYTLIYTVKKDQKVAYEKFMEEIFFPIIEQSTDPMIQKVGKTTRWLTPTKANADGITF